MGSEATKNNNTKHYIFEIITVILMFAGFFITSPALPAYGWQVLFIFIGLLVGWSTVGLIIPSILGLVALAFTDAYTIKSVWAAGFANEPIILLILFCIFSKWLEKVGFTDTLINWFLSRKSFYGRPWAFIACFFVIVFLMGFFTSVFPAILIAWPCAYKICEVLGYEKRSPFCGYLVFNITAIASMGNSCKPWSNWAITAFNSYHTVVPEGIITNGSYMVWTLAVYVIAIVLMLLFGKFFMHIDTEPFMKGDYAKAASSYNFDKTQKFACVLMVLMMIALFIPEYLPKCALKSFLKSIGTIGTISLVLIIAGGINKMNGEPFLDFKKLAAGAIPWDPIMLLTVTIPLADAMKSADSGLMQIVTNFANVYMADLSPIVFYVVVAVFLGLLTQVAHNVVLLTSFVPIFCTIGISLGMSPEIILMVSQIMLTAALGTPAASTRAGMLFGNSEYVNINDCYKLGAVSLITHAVACCAIGIPLAMIMF